MFQAPSSPLQPMTWAQCVAPEHAGSLLKGAWGALWEARLRGSAGRGPFASLAQKETAAAPGASEVTNSAGQQTHDKAHDGACPRSLAFARFSETFSALQENLYSISLQIYTAQLGYVRGRGQKRVWMLPLQLQARRPHPRSQTLERARDYA